MPISHPTLVFAIAAALYTFPSLVAVSLGRRHQWGVLAVNLTTGWTVIGWMAALRWALAKSRPQRQRRVRAGSVIVERSDDNAAAIERAQMETSWAEATSEPDLYSQWLDGGAVRREHDDTWSVAAAAPTIVPVKSDTTRKTAQRKPKGFAPTSAAA